jgi:hypothetical protein
VNASAPLHRQLLDFFSQYSKAKDLRHLKALAWMVSSLIMSGELSLPAWEPYLSSPATQAQSYEKRSGLHGVTGDWISFHHFDLFHNLVGMENIIAKVLRDVRPD